MLILKFRLNIKKSSNFKVFMLFSLKKIIMFNIIHIMLICFIEIKL